MSDKILFVDDDQNILNSFRTNFGRRYDVHTSLGPEEALGAISRDGPFKVIVSDLKMPHMDGVVFLSKVREVAPNTIRVMLTGYADMDAAILAVNRGHVFRFLTKPCPTDTLRDTIEAALEQYRLVTLEKELLRSTVWGSIKMLTEILSLVNPEAFGRSERVKRMVTAMAKDLQLHNTLKYELAAMLSQIGCVSVPADILSKKYTGTPLAAAEEETYNTSIQVAVGLLGNIPRLEEVGQIIACQSLENCKVAEASVGGRLLRLALDYDDLIQRGLTRDDALERLSASSTPYGDDLLQALERFVHREEGFKRMYVLREELAPGMILAQDLRTHEGALMLAKGLEVSRYMLECLDSVARTRSFREPIAVLWPSGNP